MGSVRLHGRRPGLEEPSVLHVELRRIQGSETVPDPFSVPSAAMRSGDFSELLANLGAINPQTGQRTGMIVDPTQCTVVGTHADLHSVPGQHHSREPPQRHLEEAARVLSGAEQRRPRRTQQQLPLAAGSRNRQVPVHAADGFRPELGIILDGPLQLRQGERDFAGVEAERHEAGHAGPSGRARQHLDAVVDARQRIPVRLQLLLQHLRTRAGVRARRGQGAGHPRHLAESCRGLGDSVHRHHRASAALATAPKGRIRTGTRRSSSATTCRGFADGIRSRLAAASATTCTTRWATSLRAAISSFSPSPPATPSPTSCSATRSRTNQRWRWR